MRELRPCLLVVVLAAGCGPGGGGTDKCADLLPGDLVISEIFGDYDAATGSTADAGKEWFEVYNATTAPIDMDGLTLTLSRPDGSKAKTHTMGTLTVPAGGYAVLGDVTPDFVTGFLDYGYGSDLGEMFNTNGGMLRISCGAADLDAATFDTVKAGQSTGFDGGVPPDATANDDVANWCLTPTDAQYMFEDANYGTPGAANYDCAVITPGQCLDGTSMRDTVVPTVGDLAISEVHPNPSGDDALQEWIEVYAIHDVDLNDIALDRAGDTSDPDVITSETCLHATAGSYYVFAKNADPGQNGGLPAVAGVFGFSLVDPGEVRVLAPNGDVLDAVAWTNAPAAASWQLDPDYLDPAANDTEADWCASKTAWAAADKGSPGVANAYCAIPGLCFDGPTRRAVVTPTVGQVAITEVFPNNTGADAQQKDWVEIRGYASVDLNGSIISKGTTGSTVITASSCIHLADGTYALLAGSTDSTVNGGLTTVDAAFDFSFNQGGDAILNDPSGALLDTVTYATAADGKSKQLDPDIAGAAGANTANDTATNWCNGATLYNGTDSGTPRAANDVQCP